MNIHIHTLCVRTENHSQNAWHGCGDWSNVGCKLVNSFVFAFSFYIYRMEVIYFMLACSHICLVNSCSNMTLGLDTLYLCLFSMLPCCLSVYAVLAFKAVVHTLTLSLSLSLTHTHTHTHTHRTYYHLLSTLHVLLLPAPQDPQCQGPAHSHQSLLMSD